MMKKIRALNITFLIVLGLNCWGQDKTVLIVRVTDITGDGMPRAHVVVRANTKKERIEDIPVKPGPRRGEFTAVVTPGIYDILISEACLLPTARQVKVTNGARQVVEVQLKYDFQLPVTDLADRDCPTPD